MKILIVIIQNLHPNELKTQAMLYNNQKKLKKETITTTTKLYPTRGMEKISTRDIYR